MEVWGQRSISASDTTPMYSHPPKTLPRILQGTHLVLQESSDCLCFIFYKNMFDGFSIFLILNFLGSTT